MPLRLNAITNNSQDPALLAGILGPIVQANDSAFVTPDGSYIHGRTEMIDTKTGQFIGHYVFTYKVHNEKKSLEILDIDLMLASQTRMRVSFLKCLPESSDANEYYDVEAAGMGQHLQIETVNRHTVAEQIEGTEREVSACAFPFQLSVYRNLRMLNKHFGFRRHKRIGKTGMKAFGFSDTFAAPGNIFAKEDAQPYSFMIGTVRSFRDVSIRIDEQKLDFVLAQVETALGIIPVAMGREVFDLKKLRKGCVISMNADVKVDLSKPEDFKR